MCLDNIRTRERHILNTKFLSRLPKNFKGEFFQVIYNRVVCAMSLGYVCARARFLAFIFVFRTLTKRTSAIYQIAGLVLLLKTMIKT
jgi:hypothetical protein